MKACKNYAQCIDYHAAQESSIERKKKLSMRIIRIIFATSIVNKFNSRYYGKESEEICLA